MGTTFFSRTEKGQAARRAANYTILSRVKVKENMDANSISLSVSMATSRDSKRGEDEFNTCCQKESVLNEVEDMMHVALRA